MKNLYACALLCALILACNSPATQEQVADAKSEEVKSPPAIKIAEVAAVSANAELNTEKVKFAPSPVQETTLAHAEPPNQQQLIKTGNVSIKTSDINRCKKSIDSLVHQFNGYYQRERFNNGTEEDEFRLSVRVQAAYFDRFLNALESGPDEMVNKEINTEDVSEEYVDLKMRLNNRKLYLKRYQEILSRAAQVKDLMTIEENIRNLQEEIESAEGRLRYLSNQVAYSTLDIYLFKPILYKHKPTEEKPFGELFKAALANSWTSLRNTILWVVAHWLGITIFAVGGYFIYRRYKEHRLKNQ